GRGFYQNLLPAQAEGRLRSEATSTGDSVFNFILGRSAHRREVRPFDIDFAVLSLRHSSATSTATGIASRLVHPNENRVGPLVVFQIRRGFRQDGESGQALREVQADDSHDAWRGLIVDTTPPSDEVRREGDSKG